MNAVNNKLDVLETVQQGQAQIQDGLRASMKHAEEVIALGNGTFEAVMKSGQVWATGVQDLAKQVAASAQASFDEAMASVKALSSVKTPQEALNLQITTARSALEKTVAESSRIGSATIKLFEDTMAPLAARATVAAEKLSKPLI
jgi:phasin family protein